MEYSITMSFAIVTLLLFGILFILMGKKMPSPTIISGKGIYVKTQEIGIVLLFFAVLVYAIGLSYRLIPITIFPLP